MSGLGHNVCALCRGSCSLMCIQAGRMEWWGCPACGGAGVRAMVQPAVICVRSKGWIRHAIPPAGESKERA